nr:acetamidase/formamidase family protein [uncultured Dethiosulfovibrio sp.]
MQKVQKENLIYAFEPGMDPVITVNPGETVRVEAWDCFKGQIQSEDTLCSEIDFGQINPATGPIFVNDAEPGDTLKVEIMGMDMANQGVTVIVPGEGILGHMVKDPVTMVIPVKDGFCLFKDIKIPIKPMIGVIGVAPEDGSFPTGTPWRHGGNMDNRYIGPGATIYLPVRQKGALLALGDCHAVMGDGEVCCSGCEIDATVTLRLDVIKGASLPWPLVETSQVISLVVSGDDLNDATEEATREGVAMIQRGKGLSWEESYMLSSLVMDLEICQLVDPKKTVRATFQRTFMTAKGLLKSTPV